MAQILLHGTLHVTIFEADSLSNPHRLTGGAPKIFRKVLESQATLIPPMQPLSYIRFAFILTICTSEHSRNFNWLVKLFYSS